MSEEKSNPVIVLAFANDQDKYLEMIRRERKNVFKALQSYHDQGYVQVHKEESTAIKDIFDLFNRYTDRIAIFHYGGHASGTHLQLRLSLVKPKWQTLPGWRNCWDSKKHYSSSFSMAAPLALRSSYCLIVVSNW